MATVRKYRYRETTSSAEGKKTAFISVIVFHAILFFYFYSFGFQVAYPRPETTKGIEIIVEEMRPQGVIRRNPQQRPVQNPPIVNNAGNSAPQSATVAATNQSTRPTPQPDSRESQLNDVGDVETPAPPPTIDNRALFQSTSKGEEDANNPNNVSENSLFPGVGSADEATRNANTPIGPDHRQPVTANLSGRSVIGSLPLPAYNSQNQGRVVVEITVNQNGEVTKATAVGRGSTVQDNKLWSAAVEAAKKAKFNVKKDAPIFQTGTITYVFSLK